MKTPMKFVNGLLLCLLLLLMHLPVSAAPQGGWKVADWIIKDEVNEISSGSLDLCNVFCRQDGNSVQLKITTRSALDYSTEIAVTLAFDQGGKVILKSDKPLPESSWTIYRGVCEIKYTAPAQWKTLSTVEVALVNLVTGSTEDQGRADMHNRNSLDNDVGNCAFVHHGNQGLTYTNVFRGTGSSNGFDEILALHDTLNLPGNFHMSGTLITAAEWYDRGFNDWLRRGVTEGWVNMLTSAYSQQIMPFVTNDMNNWAVHTEHELVNTKYNYNPRVAWIPERVWLSGGHYPDSGVNDSWLGDNWVQNGVDAVILDDWPHCSGQDSHKIHWMDNGMGITLRVIPIDGSFTGNVHFNPDAAKAQISSTGRYGLIVYGTDWEAAAELADFGCTNCLENYTNVITWVHDNFPGVGAWKLDAALDNPDFNGVTFDIHTGTYGLIGGTDGYGGSNNSWYNDWAGTASHSDFHTPVWNYGTVWTQTNQRLMTAPNNNISQSGWYVMMTNLHETAWHDNMGGPISGWEHRYSSHIKNANVYAEASHWANGEYAVTTNAFFSDIDQDGVQELVIHNDRVFAVFESIGGRAPWIFAKGPSGYNYSVVGSDNAYWNETDGDYDEANSKNHQAAFADVSPTYRDLLYSLAIDSVNDSTAQIHCSYGGITKTFILKTGQPYLDVRYDAGSQNCYIQQGFTPDLVDMIWNADLQRVWAPDVSYAGYRNPHTGATGACILNNGGTYHSTELSGTLLKIEEVRGYDRFGYLLFAGQTSAPDSQGRIPELEALKTLNLDHFGPKLNSQAAFINGSTIEATFNEAVNLTTSQNPSNWNLAGFSGSYAVTAAVRQSDWTKVRLTVTPSLAGGDHGNLIASNVTDLNGNVVSPTNNSATLSVPSGVTPHTVVIDGTKDFDLSNELIYAGADSLCITWDSLALYIGYWNRDFGTNGDFFINIDTDQLTGSGAATDSWSRVHFADPFKIEYQLAIESGGDALQLNHWSGTAWQYHTPPAHSATAYVGWSGNLFTEVRIPWSDLGNPTGIALNAHITQENNQTTLRAFPTGNPTGSFITLSQVYRIYQPYISGPMPLMGARPKYLLSGNLGSPNNLVIQDISGTRRLTWPAISGAASYVIYRADTADGTYSPIGETATTTFDDSSALSGSRVFYVVQAKAGI